MTTSSSPGILLVAFGVTTRYGKPALAAFSDKVRAAFPGHAVRWAFTARHRAKRPTLSGEGGLDVAAALDLFAQDGATRVAVQPLHLVAGLEHAAFCRRVAAWRKGRSDMHIGIGDPLLADDAAMRAALDAMKKIGAQTSAPDEAAVWIGHGSKKAPSSGYLRLMELADAEKPPVYIGCLSGGPDPETVAAKLQANGKTKACLAPLFVLSGYHAARDMAGKGQNSWRSRLAAAGVACRSHLQGLVEHDLFADMWLARLREALTSLDAPDGPAP